MSTILEFLLQIETTQTWHDDIEHQIYGSVNAIGCKEFIGGRESENRKIEFCRQVSERLANAFVVINDYYYETLVDVFCS